MSEKVSPFDLIDGFFNSKKWDTFTNIEKNRNFFIINRLMSINYPIPAALFSHMKMPGGMVVEFWKRFMSRNFKTKPGWFFTKSKSEVKKDPFDNYEDEVLEYYYKVNDCDYKTVNELKKKYPKELTEELESIVKMFKTYESRPKKSKK